MNTRPDALLPGRPDWPRLWAGLATASGLAIDEPVLLALSGGADSVFLLHCLARSRPRPRVLAVHVDHGLRGRESAEDAAFCARQCAELEVPFTCRHLRLDPAGANLEARARALRYEALLEEAAREGFQVVLTGHHQDDAIETLLMRWVRGTALSGLAGLRRECRMGPVRVVRPLFDLRRIELRALLGRARIPWREDSSNASPAHTRNRVRHLLLPEIQRTCGERGVESLRAFARAVQDLEEELAARTAYLSWSPLACASAHRSSAEAHLGGRLERRALTELPATLQRRALWRLLTEATGHAPSRALLQSLLEDLASGRNLRRTLPGGWIWHARPRSLELYPGAAHPRPSLHGPSAAHQLALPFPAPAGIAPEAAWVLPLAGAVELPDGRSISAEVLEAPPSREVPRSGVEVELDAHDLPRELTVRTAKPGDRFHGLGAPGSRPLVRFLADAGVPREERTRVPLVFAGTELIWVAGIRPCESRRVHARTERRLLLRLLGAAPSRPPAARAAGLFAVAGGPRRP